jgi:hypothetical protein
MTDTPLDSYSLPSETAAERTGHLSALAEVEWLMDNSDGVSGLRLDGKVMPWAEVRSLYLPTWHA